jgi:hypothetical protein
MPSKPYPPDVLKQAQDVAGGLNQMGTAAPTLGTLTPATLAADVTAAIALEAEMVKLEAQLTDKRNQRDALYCQLWDKVKRVRSGVKGIYGDDSSQYEMVGGTRVSERKTPTRRVAKA